MDLPIENTYGFFRVDERCKKLERTVKMLQLKELEKKNIENYSIDTRTNISSINGDALDSSYAYSSKLGSEIVSSSANMKNLFVHKKNLLNNNIATSSVKNSPDSDPTRAIMPPPKNVPTFSNSSRKNTPAAREASALNAKRGPTKLESNFYSTSSIISSIKCPKSHDANSPIQYSTGIENFQKDVTDITKPDRIFERWKVIINDRGQLIIKGILKDGKKNVRSKAVIRRISASVVQSCFNHIYELQGRIYDDLHELPEYIRRKFNNGFPDDWENDFQLWRSYISGGCKSSFRWPTRVTDSDDDIKSEITELAPSEEAKKSHSIKSRRNSIRIERTQKNPPETIADVSRIPTENSKLSVQNVTNQSSKKTISLSEESHDKAAEMNSYLGNIHDKHPSDLSRTNHTIDGDISSMVDTILNYKNCSIEYIDKIIERLNCYKNFIKSKSSNLLTNITHDGVSMRTTERASLTERTSNNSDIRDSKVDNIESHTPEYINSHSVRNHSYDFDSASKTSSCGSNLPSIRKVRRKLYKKDDDSSALSDSDTETKRRSPRKVSKISKNRNITKTVSNKKYPVPTVGDDSDDNCVPNKTVYTHAENTHINKPANEVHTQKNTIQQNEVDFEDFKKPMPKNESKNLSINPRKTNLPPSKSYRKRNTGSPSTITGFLENYDSCVSISEDDRRVNTPRPKLDNKRTVNDIDGKTLSSFKLKLHQENSKFHYDSSVSITEDERNYVGNQTNGPDIRKQVLQEPNIQCFQQMLKRNLKHNTNTTGFLDKKHLQDYPMVQKQSPSTQSKEPKDFAFSKHITANSNENKENTSDRVEKEKQVNQHISGIHQTNVNKTYQLSEKMKPSIVNIEEVSYEVDDLLLKEYHPEDTIKNDSLKNRKNESISKGNSILPMSSTTNNVSSTTNSKPVEVNFKRACKDVSVQLKDIKDVLKLKPNAQKNVNNDRTKEQVVFGSEENPKQLTSWCPNVIKKTDSTYGLVFEGKLLNEAGLVVDKKFRTGFIEKKVSSKVIKTEKNEFYQLIGDFTDTKHIVPKELYKSCLNGCPGQMKKFCEQWKSIIEKNESDRITNESDQSDESINSMNVQGAAQSSRGRRILPPLSYWSGERLSTKGDNTIYTPPTSFCTSFEISKKDRLLSVKKNMSNPEKQDRVKYYSKEKENVVNDQIIDNNTDSQKTIRPKSRREETKLRRSYRKRKELMKINEQIIDNDSSSEEEYPVSKRRRSGYGDAQKESRSQESLNKNDTEKANFDKDEEKKSKRSKNFSDKQNNSPIKSNQVTIKYYQTSSRKNDLSEYESSIVG